MDKYKHFIVGAIIASIWLTFWNRAIWFDFLGQWAILIGYFQFILGTILFEVYQKLTKTGQFEWGDVIAGGLGAAVIFVTILANT